MLFPTTMSKKRTLQPSVRRSLPFAGAVGVAVVTDKHDETLFPWPPFLTGFEIQRQHKRQQKRFCPIFGDEIGVAGAPLRRQSSRTQGRYNAGTRNHFESNDRLKTRRGVGGGGVFALKELTFTTHRTPSVLE